MTKMTNGEKIIAILKPRKDQIRIYDNWVEIEIQKLGINFSCELDWWNIECNEPSNKSIIYKAKESKEIQKDLDELRKLNELTTKNDLGVDWESYKDVDGNSLDDLILDVIQRNFDCGNTYGYKVADEIIGLLPSVTPQEPILDKIRAEIKNLERFEIRGEVTPLVNVDRVLKIIDKVENEVRE